MFRQTVAAAFLALACGAVVPALQAQHTCGLDARNQKAVPLPVLSQDTMPRDLETQTREAYQTGLVEYRSVDAEREFLALRQRAIAESNPCAEALAEFGLSSIYRLLRLPDSRPHLLRAQALFEPIGTPLTMALIHLRLAALKHMTGDNPGFLADEPAVRKELLDAGDEATEIEEETGGIEWEDTGNTLDQQAALYQRAMRLTSPNGPSVRGSVERNWGADLRRAGRNAEAMQHLRHVVDTLSECHCNPSALGTAYLEMGLAAVVGSDAAAALDYGLKGDRVYEQFHLDSFRPQALRVISVAYGMRGQYLKEIDTLKLALDLLHKQGAAFAVVPTDLMLAQAYGNAGQPNKGLELMAAAKAGKLTPIQNCLVAGMTSTLADQAGDYERAASEGHATLDRCKDNMAPLDYAQLGITTAHADLKLGRPEKALALGQGAVEIVNGDRSHLEMTDRNLVAFDQTQSNVYTVLIEAYVALKKPEDALLAAEQGRGRAFVDLTTTERRSGQSRPALNKTAPELPVEVHPFTLSVADLRQQLAARHATMLSYWLADGHLFTWVLAPGRDVEVRDQAVHETDMAALVRSTLPSEGAFTRRGGPGSRTLVSTRSGRSQSTAQPSQKPWNDLYNLLIAPVADALPQEEGSLLTIEPYGPLFDLAFAALKDASGHYLVERYAVNTVPAASVLQITQKNDTAAAALPTHYLVLADPERYPVVDGARLSALPGTLAEARGIQQQLGGKTLTLLAGRKAGIDNFEGELPHATVLHLATHALVSDTAPSSSFLALDSRQQGGKLTAAAIYGLHVNASLVVLSACSTGRGKITGDGVAGLSRAFFYAGAASLVTTLWDVVDEPTARLMPNFYGSLSKGESRSAALREAQLSLIRDLRAHRVTVQTLAGSKVFLKERPTYWAAFSLAGQP